MEKAFLSSEEIARSWIGIGQKKAALPTLKVIFLGVLAGMFVGFGAHADIIVMQTVSKAANPGLVKLLGASVFPVGIILVVIAGAELFTGNCLISLAVINRDERMVRLIKNLLLVFAGNFAGSLFLAFLLAKSGLYNPDAAAKAIAIAEGKSQLPMAEAIIRGFFCNILVVLAVWMQTGSKDISGKILTLWFPVMLFVLSGFEHSIANLFFIPLGIFLGAGVTWSEMFFNNIIPVTIGNLIGGAVFMPYVYWYVYISGQKKHIKAKEEVQLIS